MTREKPELLVSRGGGGGGVVPCIGYIGMCRSYAAPKGMFFLAVLV